MEHLQGPRNKQAVGRSSNLSLRGLGEVEILVGDGDVLKKKEMVCECRLRLVQYRVSAPRGKIPDSLSEGPSAFQNKFQRRVVNKVSYACGQVHTSL